MWYLAMANYVLWTNMFFWWYWWFKPPRFVYKGAHLWFQIAVLCYKHTQAHKLLQFISHVYPRRCSDDLRGRLLVQWPGQLHSEVSVFMQPSAVLCSFLHYAFCFYLHSYLSIVFSISKWWVCFVRQKNALDTTALHSLPRLKRGIIFLCWLLGWRTAISHAGKCTHTQKDTLTCTHTGVYIKMHTPIPVDIDMGVLCHYCSFIEMNILFHTPLQRRLLIIFSLQIWKCVFRVCVCVFSLRA